MDIYKYAEEFDADYYDPAKGVIYQVQKYNRNKKLGLPDPGIEITDLEGNLIRHVKKNK